MSVSSSTARRSYESNLRGGVVPYFGWNSSTVDRLGAPTVISSPFGRRLGAAANPSVNARSPSYLSEAPRIPPHSRKGTTIGAIVVVTVRKAGLAGGSARYLVF